MLKVKHVLKHVLLQDSPLRVTNALLHVLQIEINPLQTTASSLMDARAGGILETAEGINKSKTAGR